MTYINPSWTAAPGHTHPVRLEELPHAEGSNGPVRPLHHLPDTWTTASTAGLAVTAGLQAQEDSEALRLLCMPLSTRHTQAKPNSSQHGSLHGGATG